MCALHGEAQVLRLSILAIQREPLGAGEERALPAARARQRHRCEARGMVGRQHPPAAGVARAAALELVVVDHGGARRADALEHEALTGGLEALDGGRLVDRMAVGELEAAVVRQRGLGDHAAVAVAGDDFGAAATTGGDEREGADGHPHSSASR